MFAVIICLSLCLSQCTLIRAREESKIPPKPSEPEDAPPKNPLSRGWNDDIAWVSLDEGLKIAKEQRKPVFVLIHKTWCHACQNLKKTFVKAKTIQDLSHHFVMVNCEDDEEPWEEDYSPDNGKYIPRLLFVDPDGSVIKDVKNPKEEFQQYPYYYSNPAPIITAMKQVMNKFHLTDTTTTAAPEGAATGKKEKSEDKKEEKSEDKEEKKPKTKKEEKPKKDKKAEL